MSIKNGLKKYADGSWGVSLYVPARFSPKGKRTRFQQKIGTKTLAKMERDRISLGWRQGEPAHLRSRQEKGNPRVKELAKIWVESRGSKARDRSDIKDTIRVFGDAYPSAITTTHIQKFILALKENGYANGTINKKINCLRGVLQIALERGLIQRSPFMLGRSFNQSEKDSKRKVLVSREQEKKLLDELGEHAPLARFAILTGMRQGEQLGLKWKDILWEKKQAFLKKTKNGRQRFVPLSKEALGILKNQKALQKPSEYCFPSPRGGRWPSSSFRVMVWRPAFKRAGLEHARWHDLRHACVTRMLEAGVPTFTAGKVVGHTTQSMIDTYGHIGQDHLLEAVEKID